jgi:hypothetical protein
MSGVSKRKIEGTILILVTRACLQLMHDGVELFIFRNITDICIVSVCICYPKVERLRYTEL